MQTNIAETPGSELTGLENRLKTPESFKEKISTAIRDDPGISMTTHLTSMKDSVRYTLLSPEGAYANNVIHAIHALLAEGYETVKFKN